MVTDFDIIPCIIEPNVRMRGTTMDTGDASPLFDDTSAGGHKHSGKNDTGQAFLSDPMSNLAMVYGSSLASHGKEMMDKNVGAFLKQKKTFLLL